jgi:hypothetical protein
MQPHAQRQWGTIVVSGPGAAEVTSWPLAGAGLPDLTTIHVLARLQLAAQRLGYAVGLRDVCGELQALLTLTGLSDVLCCVQMVGQAEGGEQVGVEKEVQADDPIP